MVFRALRRSTILRPYVATSRCVARCLARASSSHVSKCRANHAPLSPVPWLERAALIFPDRTAVKYGTDIKVSYSELQTEARRLASAISRAGVGKGEIVSVMIPNVPLGVTCHFAVPGIGATLHMINTRLDARAVAFQLEHAVSKLLIVDCELASVAKAALEIMEEQNRPRLVLVEDPLHPQWSSEDEEELADFVRTGDPEFSLCGPDNEDDAVALSYTSGTTGNPKGVVTHHRGAALNAMNLSLTWPLVGNHVVYLWTLPMFHCNGWCFPWAVTAAGGTHVCLRYVRGEEILERIAAEKVTHMSGAPVVMNLMLATDDDRKRTLRDQVASRSGDLVKMMTAGSAPPPSVMRRMETELGVQPLASYGLTEVYGPATACVWGEDWSVLSQDEQDLRMPWQAPSLIHDMYVANRKGLEPVPADGVTLGEVVFRGNGVMTEYLNNVHATSEAFDQGEWFRTGDLAVQHPEGRVEIKDRAKDIIISGGENISSIEVESALHQHEAVLHVAVVAAEDRFWGEIPIAVVETKPGVQVSAEDILQHARRTLAGFKCPKDVVFQELPKTATGKIQKHLLRAGIRAARQAEVAA